jgi:hypothetical protein
MGMPQCENRPVTGLRAELSIAAADSCPVAALSTETDDSLREVTWTGARSEGGGAVERFDTHATVADASKGDDDVAGDDGNVPTTTADRAPEFDTVFDDGDTRTLEFQRDWDDCVCERIEAVGCPVDDVRAVEGRLLIQFRVRSNERLRDVIAAAREISEDVRLNYVVSAGAERSDTVLVDRGRLTERQREVLETAYDSGYFDHPREQNAAEIAAELDISPSTFREHIAAAQAKLLGSVVEE